MLVDMAWRFPGPYIYPPCSRLPHNFDVDASHVSLKDLPSLHRQQKQRAKFVGTVGNCLNAVELLGTAYSYEKQLPDK